MSEPRVVILCGGRGERLGAMTTGTPKALVEVGGRPILWHIMRGYASQGFRDFVLCLGYREDAFRNNDRYLPDDCMVELLYTGENTQTGGRLKRAASRLGDGTFLLTWCDGVSDVDLHTLLAFHRAHGKLATVTAVHPPPRFGAVTLDGDRVMAFVEKPPAAREWINGAFFALEPGALAYASGDDSAWECGPMGQLAADGQLMAFRHEGFWQCMDTPRDRDTLERSWLGGKAPWKTWND